MLKVNENPWKFPDGRLACGLSPLEERKFSSFWLTELPLGGTVALECLRLLCQFFNVNFPFLSQLGYSSFLRIVIFMINW